MRTYKKLIAAAAVAATAAGLAVVPAVADPPGGLAPSNAITGVGADTTQSLFDQFSIDYNARKPRTARSLYSWDALGTANIEEKGTIVTDNCRGPRPNGSAAGIDAMPPLALVFNLVDKNPRSTGWCTDFARSAFGPATFPPNVAAALKWVPFATDGVTWASNKGSPAPASLTQAQLVAIYTCHDRFWNQVGGKPGRIDALLPLGESGTRKFFLQAIGHPGPPVIPGSCVTGAAGENEGYDKFVRPLNVIVPYSIPVYLAQVIHSASCKSRGCGGPINPATGTPFCKKPRIFQNLFGCDYHVNMQLGEIASVAPTVPFPLSPRSVLNLRFKPFFLRSMFVVVRKAAGQPGHVPKYLQPLFGPTGWITTPPAQTYICDYGFADPPKC